MPGSQLDEKAVGLVLNRGLYGAMAKRVDAVPFRGETHLPQPGLEPANKLRLLERDEASSRRGDQEDRGIWRQVPRAIRFGEAGEGRDRAVLGVGGGRHRNVVVVGAELVCFGDGDVDDDTVFQVLDIAPLEQVPKIEVLAGFRDHVGTSGHRLEKEEGQGLVSVEDMVLCGATRVVRDGVQQVCEDGWGDGKSFLHPVGGLALETLEELVEGAVGRGGVAVYPQPPVDGADGRKVDLDAAGGLELPDHHEPHREVAQLVAIESYF